VAEFVLGNPDEDAPIELIMAMIPFPAKSWEDESVMVPEGLKNIKAKYALVPVPSRQYDEDDSLPIFLNDIAPCIQHVLVQNFVK